MERQSWTWAMAGAVLFVVSVLVLTVLTLTPLKVWAQQEGSELLVDLNTSWCCNGDDLYEGQVFWLEEDGATITDVRIKVDGSGDDAANVYLVETELMSAGTWDGEPRPVGMTDHEWSVAPLCSGVIPADTWENHFVELEDCPPLDQGFYAVVREAASAGEMYWGYDHDDSSSLFPELPQGGSWVSTGGSFSDKDHSTGEYVTYSLRVYGSGEPDPPEWWDPPLENGEPSVLAWQQYEDDEQPFYRADDHTPVPMQPFTVFATATVDEIAVNLAGAGMTDIVAYIHEINPVTLAPDNAFFQGVYSVTIDGTELLPGVGTWQFGDGGVHAVLYPDRTYGLFLYPLWADDFEGGHFDWYTSSTSNPIYEDSQLITSWDGLGAGSAVTETFEEDKRFLFIIDGHGYEAEPPEDTGGEPEPAPDPETYDFEWSRTNLYRGQTLGYRFENMEGPVTFVVQRTNEAGEAVQTVASFPLTPSDGEAAFNWSTSGVQDGSFRVYDTTNGETLMKHQLARRPVPAAYLDADHRCGTDCMVVIGDAAYPTEAGDGRLHDPEDDAQQSLSTVVRGDTTLLHYAFDIGTGAVDHRIRLVNVGTNEEVFSVSLANFHVYSGVETVGTFGGVVHGQSIHDQGYVVLGTDGTNPASVQNQLLGGVVMADLPVGVYQYGITDEHGVPVSDGESVLLVKNNDTPEWSLNVPSVTALGDTANVGVGLRTSAIYSVYRHFRLEADWGETVETSFQGNFATSKSVPIEIPTSLSGQLPQTRGLELSVMPITTQFGMPEDYAFGMSDETEVHFECDALCSTFGGLSDMVKVLGSLVVVGMGVVGTSFVLGPRSQFVAFIVGALLTAAFVYSEWMPASVVVTLTVLVGAYYILVGNNRQGANV